MRLAACMPVTQGCTFSVDHIVTTAFDCTWLPAWDQDLRWVLVRAGAIFSGPASVAMYAVRVQPGRLLTGAMMFAAPTAGATGIAADRLDLWSECPPRWNGKGDILIGEQLDVAGTRTATVWSADSIEYAQLVFHGYERVRRR